MGKERKAVLRRVETKDRRIGRNRRHIVRQARRADRRTARIEIAEDLELATGIYPEFSLEKYLAGEQQPVFFGSALNNFGVSELLDTFVEIAPSPRPKTSDVRQVEPDEEKFTGFVFKIHANMDPKHRDRLAFVKIVSRNVPPQCQLPARTPGQTVQIRQPERFFRREKTSGRRIVPRRYRGTARYRQLQDRRYADGRRSAQFQRHTFFLAGTFPVYRQCRPDESQTAGKRHRPIDGRRRSQLFTLDLNGRKIIGTVGALQYEVIQYRLEHEYGAKCTYEPVPVYKACWVQPEDPAGEEFADFMRVKSRFMAHDKDGRQVFLADSAFSITMAQEKYPTIHLHFTSEF